jgi:hypothetical protein
MGRGGGGGRELAARVGGGRKVGDWVLKIQRVLELYRVRADARFGLPTLVCGGRKRILGSALNFFYRSRHLRVLICTIFLATTHK